MGLGRKRGKSTRDSKTFLVPLPLSSWYFKSVINSIQDGGKAPHPCPAGLHPWLLLLRPFLVMPESVCVCICVCVCVCVCACVCWGLLTRNWAITLGRRDRISGSCQHDIPHPSSSIAIQHYFSGMAEILKIKISYQFDSGLRTKSCLGPESWPGLHSTVVDT